MKKLANQKNSVERNRSLKEATIYDLTQYRSSTTIAKLKKVRKKTGGRQLISFTKEQIAQVESLAAKYTCNQIASHFEISKKTFYDIRKRQPEVERVYKKGKAKQIIDIVTLFEKIAFGEDTSDIIFYLKTQAGWSTKNKDMDDVGY